MGGVREKEKGAPLTGASLSRMAEAMEAFARGMQALADTVEAVAKMVKAVARTAVQLDASIRMLLQSFSQECPVCGAWVLDLPGHASTRRDKLHRALEVMEA